ncbi:MAG: hypothetical protein Q9M92_12545 [Enterobacterales bacterium]|nr:hypothetical protein [Enterobacterales bacterium]
MAFVIIASVVGISVIQRREQVKAKLAEQISKLRFRANEADRILENFANIPIGAESREILLKFIQLNLSKIQKLSPNNQAINANIASINQKLQAPSLKIDQSRLVIPKNNEQLKLLIKNLNQLASYLQKFQSITKLNQKIPLAVNKISFFDC